MVYELSPKRSSLSKCNKKDLQQDSSVIIVSKPVVIQTQKNIHGRRSRSYDSCDRLPEQSDSRGSFAYDLNYNIEKYRACSGNSNQGADQPGRRHSFDQSYHDANYVEYFLSREMRRHSIRSDRKQAVLPLPTAHWERKRSCTLRKCFMCGTFSTFAILPFMLLAISTYVPKIPVNAVLGSQQNNQNRVPINRFRATQRNRTGNNDIQTITDSNRTRRSSHLHRKLQADPQLTDSVVTRFLSRNHSGGNKRWSKHIKEEFPQL